MFVTAVDRALVKRGIADGGRKVGSFVPNNFHEVPRSRRCMSRRWRRLSTAAGGKISRIAHCAAARRPGHDSAHRHGLLYVVTEFGSPNLKGLSSIERAHALIGLAHPQFHEELTAAAKNLNLI
jgi:hypothetical protein